MTNLPPLGISLQLNTNSVAGEFNVALKKIEQQAAKTRINLDTRSATSQIEQLQARMSKMTGVAPRVTVNTAEATSQVAKLTAQVETLQKKAATSVKVSGGTSGPMSSMGSLAGGAALGALSTVIGGYSAAQILGSSLEKAGHEQRMSAGLDRALRCAWHE